MYVNCKAISVTNANFAYGLKREENMHVVLKGAMKGISGMNINYPTLQVLKKDLGKQLNKKQNEIEYLQSEVEKYRKAFEDAKEERDCQVAEYRKMIEELTNEKESLETRLKLLKSERDDLREEVEKLRNAQDFSNLEPIGVANIIINAEGTRENLFGRITGKGATETYRIFETSELRQIAEHLLVYCNHNGEAEE